MQKNLLEKKNKEKIHVEGGNQLIKLGKLVLR